MKYDIALIGNPNCGKSTVFNELTGEQQYVGNWAGVTIEKKEGLIDDNLNLVDLPGIYSLSPYTLEEIVSRKFLIDNKPDLIINILDASNLERNLYLTTQIMELDIPIIIILNMMDIVKKRGESIDVDILSNILHIPIIPVTASKKIDKEVIIKSIYETIKNPQKQINHDIFSDDIEAAIDHIHTIMDKYNLGSNKHFVTIKLLEDDKLVSDKIKFTKEDYDHIKRHTKELEEKYNDDINSIIISQRYEYISHLSNQVIITNEFAKPKLSSRIDSVLTNKILAYPIFFAIMAGIFYLSVGPFGAYLGEWVAGVIDILGENIANFLVSLEVADWLIALVSEGIFGGVGAVLGFIPQLAILFILLSILEDCGYMARVALIMDRIFHSIGLSGKSFIPLLIGTGCSVPAIMSTRTIENEHDRKLTIILAPFIPCGAKLPVFALFTAIFFPNYPWVGVLMYALGIVMVIISGFILRKTIFKGKEAPFFMELPEYHLPKAKNTLRQAWQKIREFIIRAGTVIFVASAILWLLQNFDMSLNMVSADESILAGFGRLISPIFAPLGIGQWELSVSILTGFIAKEIIVATLGVLFPGDLALILPTFISSAAGLSFMVFTLLVSPCIAAITAMKVELGSWKETLFALAYQTTIAWLMAFVIYRIALLIL